MIALLLTFVFSLALAEPLDSPSFRVRTAAQRQLSDAPYAVVYDYCQTMGYMRATDKSPWEKLWTPDWPAWICWDEVSPPRGGWWLGEMRTAARDQRHLRVVDVAMQFTYRAQR